MAATYTPTPGEQVTANAGGTDFTVTIHGNQAPALPLRWAGYYSSQSIFGETVWHSVLGGISIEDGGRKRAPMMEVHFIHSFETRDEAISDCRSMCGEEADQ